MLLHLFQLSIGQGHIEDAKLGGRQTNTAIRLEKMVSEKLCPGSIIFICLVNELVVLSA